MQVLMNKNNNQKGFTLLEVMIAIALIAIIIPTLFVTHSKTISMSIESQFNSLAPLLAQGKLAEFETKAAEDLISGSGDFGSELQGYKWEVVVDTVVSEELGNYADDLKVIDVIVSNIDNISVNLRTYRMIIDSND
jgi:general secretion pathway protein I